MNPCPFCLETKMLLINARAELEQRIKTHKLTKPRDIQGLRKMYACRNTIQKCINIVARFRFLMPATPPPLQRAIIKDATKNIWP